METIEGNKLIGIVYQIRNTVNGKVYVGSSTVFTKRRRRHFEQLKYNNHHSVSLQRAYNKYGKECFVIEVLEELVIANKKELLAKEQFYLDTLKPSYNICMVAGSQLGAKRSADFKKECSNRMKGKEPWNKGKAMGPQSEITKNRRSVAMAGKSHSEETKVKMSKMAMGRKFSEQHKDKLSKSHIKHGKYARR